MTTEDDARTSPIKFFFPLQSTQPSGVSGVVGGTASFTAGFSSTNPALVTFQWQYSTDGITWDNLVETPGYYENVTSLTLNVKALDNFLATQQPCMFRCRALFANAVPSFTLPALLLVAKYLTWLRGFGGLAVVGSGGTQFLAVTAPAPVGFTGPFTYQWNYVSGAVFICADATLQTGVFSYAGPDGLQISVWTVTVSNGTTTITSDPIYLAIYFGATASGDTIPAFSTNGAAFTTVPHFGGPWLLATTLRNRAPASPTVAIAAPASAASTFSLSATYPGGTSIVAVLNPQSNLAGTFVIGYSQWLHGP